MDASSSGFPVTEAEILEQTIKRFNKNPKKVCLLVLCSMNMNCHQLCFVLLLVCFVGVSSMHRVLNLLSVPDTWNRVRKQWQIFSFHKKLSKSPLLATS
jgi:hypothetical protein